MSAKEATPRAVTRQRFNIYEGATVIFHENSVPRASAKRYNTDKVSVNNV